jgi:lipopolysaccharide transport protein LptA
VRALSRLVALVVAASAAERAALGEEAASEVEIVADRVEYDREAGRAEFQGGVQLRHGQVELECDRMVVEMGAEGRLVTVVASGHVRVRGRGFDASAGAARYEPAAGRVLLSDDPRVTASAGELRGRTIVVSLGDGRLSVERARGVFRVH